MITASASQTTVASPFKAGQGSSPDRGQLLNCPGQPRTDLFYLEVGK